MPGVCALFELDDEPVPPPVGKKNTLWVVLIISAFLLVLVGAILVFMKKRSGESAVFEDAYVNQTMATEGTFVDRKKARKGSEEDIPA